MQSRLLRPVPFNEAESMLVPFWDPSLAALSAFEICPDDRAGVRVYQNWCWVAIEWSRQAQPGMLAQLRCRADAELFDEDEMMVYGGLARGTTLTVRARIDGKVQAPLDRVPGNDRESEWSGAINGKRIEELEIEVAAAETLAPGSVSLMWIGIANAAARDRMLARRRAYRPDFSMHVLPSSDIPDPVPQLGLFFGAEDLETLRRKANSPAYRALMDRMRGEAAAALAAHPPEEIYGVYAIRGFGAGTDNFKRPCDDRWTPLVAARVCAFVGLLDRSPDLLAYAARCAMALAHCDTWVGGPMENLRGSRWHQRSFLEAIHVQTCLEVWDWAGSALTPEGRAFLRHAICAKALGRIQQDAWEHEYIHHCNQGPLFFSPWLMALVSMRAEWPRVMDLIPTVERYLAESIGNYLNEDGGASEGPSYVLHTMVQTAGLYVWARAQGRRFPEYLRGMMPERFFRITDYCRTMMATPLPGKPLSFLTVGDSGHSGLNRFSPDAALLLYLATGDALWETIFADALADVGKLLDPPFWPGLPVLFALGPEQPRQHAVGPPEFHRLPVTGQLVSCRMGDFGPVRLQLCGNMAGAGHAHHDSGGFILEVCGEELAIDRGILTYSDLRSYKQHYASQHNMLLPIIPGDVEPCQSVGAPAAVVPEGTGDDRSLSAWIDTTPHWNGLIKRHLRRIDSAEPNRFVIVDEVEFDEPRAVAFNLHSRAPIRSCAGGAWRVCGARASLSICPQWSAAEAAVFEDGVDGAGRPVNRLCLKTAPALKHRLTTEIAIERI